jgi:hypothetical protein
LRVLHVTRNPYDTIAMMWRRKGPEAALEDRISHFFSLVETVTKLKDRLAPGELLDVRHEDLIHDPAAVLKAIGGFPSWRSTTIRDCSSILFSAPRASRQHAPWTPELVARTQGEIDRFRLPGRLLLRELVSCQVGSLNLQDFSWDQVREVHRHQEIKVELSEQGWNSGLAKGPTSSHVLLVQVLAALDQLLGMGRRPGG